MQFIKVYFDIIRMVSINLGKCEKSSKILHLVQYLFSNEEGFLKLLAVCYSLGSNIICATFCLGRDPISQEIKAQK